MSQIANITVYDGAATPVAHTLVPVSVVREGNKISALWRENLTSVPIYAQVSCKATLEQMKSGIWRAAVRIEVPVMESISGQNAAGYTAAPKVAYTDTNEYVGFFHERSTIAGKRLVRQMGANLLGNISTSVTPVTSGPIPELFDQLLMPT